MHLRKPTDIFRVLTLLEEKMLWMSSCKIGWRKAKFLAGGTSLRSSHLPSNCEKKVFPGWRFPSKLMKSYEDILRFLSPLIVIHNRVLLNPFCLVRSQSQSSFCNKGRSHWGPRSSQFSPWILQPFHQVHYNRGWSPFQKIHLGNLGMIHSP